MSTLLMVALTGQLAAGLPAQPPCQAQALRAPVVFEMPAEGAHARLQRLQADAPVQAPRRHHHSLSHAPADAGAHHAIISTDVKHAGNPPLLTRRVVTVDDVPRADRLRHTHQAGPLYERFGATSACGRTRTR